MKARPILFHSPMVRALLAGTKTQTRRIVKIQPPPNVQTQFLPIYCGPDVQNDPRPVFTWRRPGWFDIETQYCPYGQTGDRLWVRETWMHLYNGSIGLRADLDLFGQVPRRGDPNGPRFNTHHGEWRPSIHMRRSSSRLTLEITDVRVERLQAISEADAEAEGIERNARYDGWDREDGWIDPTGHDEDFPAESAVEAYRALWESINGPGSWDANPWVWVLTFKRAQA